MLAFYFKTPPLTNFIFLTSVSLLHFQTFLLLSLNLFISSSLPLWTDLPIDETSASFLGDFYYLHVVADR